MALLQKPPSIEARKMSLFFPKRACLIPLTLLWNSSIVPQVDRAVWIFASFLRSLWSSKTQTGSTSQIRAWLMHSLTERLPDMPCPINNSCYRGLFFFSTMRMNRVLTHSRSVVNCRSLSAEFSLSPCHHLSPSLALCPHNYPVFTKHPLAMNRPTYCSEWVTALLCGSGEYTTPRTNNW